MISLPQKITISSNPRKQALKYFLPCIAAFWVSSFAFSGKIPNGNIVGTGSILLAILIIIGVYQKDKRSKKTIEITEDGIREVKNGIETFIGWDENHQTYYTGTEFQFGGILPIGSIATTQVVAEGKHIKIDYPSNQFHESILLLSYNNVFSLIKKQLEEGKKVNFGTIELDNDHIYLKRKTIRRTEIQKIKVINGRVILKRSDNWFSTKILVRDIPNLSCLIDLLQTKQEED